MKTCSQFWHGLCFSFLLDAARFLLGRAGTVGLFRKTGSLPRIKNLRVRFFKSLLYHQVVLLLNSALKSIFFYTFKPFLVILMLTSHVSALGKAEPRRGVSVHGLPVWRCHPHQTVLQGASRASVPLWAPRRSAQSSRTSRPAGQDGSPAAADLPASSQELLLPALSVRLPLQSFKKVWKGSCK